MLLVLSVLLVNVVGRSAVSDSAQLCAEHDIVSTCDQSTLTDWTSPRRSCRCDELCPLYADCCLDYLQPVAVNSLRGTMLSLSLSLSLSVKHVHMPDVQTRRYHAVEATDLKLVGYWLVIK